MQIYILFSMIVIVLALLSTFQVDKLELVSFIYAEQNEVRSLEKQPNYGTAFVTRVKSCEIS